MLLEGKVKIDLPVELVEKLDGVIGAREGS